VTNEKHLRTAQLLERGYSADEMVDIFQVGSLRFCVAGDVSDRRASGVVDEVRVGDVRRRCRMSRWCSCLRWSRGAIFGNTVLRLCCGLANWAVT